MVGTAYLAREPGAAPFITPGKSVKEGEILLLIEAMKTYNEVRAPRAGRVTRILVTDGAPVEFGEPLLILE
jgi:acetyl-CoA carboxylase biotin carboxyl carrier protein